MAGSVPLARRDALADPRRLLASALGVGLALMLILLLDGLWAGVRQQATRYENETGAQLYVLAPGTRSLFAEGSQLSNRLVTEVRDLPGVRWAAPVRTQYVILDLHAHKVAANLVGSVPGAPGGPWALARGRPPAALDEVSIDNSLAREHGIRIGGHVSVLGRDLRVVGLTARTASFMTAFLFVTYDTAGRMLHTDNATAVLVGTDHPTAVAAGLKAHDLNVVTGATLRATALAIMTRSLGTVLQLMLGVAFTAGTLVIALVAYNAVTERRREFGIVKAIGATRRRLVGVAVRQTALVGMIGLLFGVGLFMVGRALIVAARPQFSVVLTRGSITQAIIAAAAMTIVGASLPAWRLAKLEPAVAYRSA